MVNTQLPPVSEHIEQKNFIQYVTMQYRNNDEYHEKLLFAVPNGAWFGGKNTLAMYKKFQAEGLRKGIADLVYLQPRGKYYSLVIEMKRSDKKNDKKAVSKDQRIFLQVVQANGGAAAICFGCDEAIEVFDWYMALPRKEVINE